ncbi:MAG: hypothetical protein A2275_17620 [Bacteroidetes bacterium RIFOXYA12_FULL_35_11]|nr:MAG: hypothetical protein A2X01_07180 [Bacteroidetes bacterium GWF2_35_48]OFY79699.1 MAG: hypothetical protein A2275_17620 [Bacteroidetes bacterium RIFOXYA12_FULL_35_11]OFY97773.1 MAG: hypothetical protein A2491_03260 [Bacteroidetes bacterium RIFOXYC12_FULL_35_7]HBX53168.1 hypothetical protein [Bacteroidales bacterium]
MYYLKKNHIPFLKLLVFAITLLSFQNIKAQNYKCIKTDAITHFEGANSIIASIRIDSVFYVGDTIDNISFHMIRDTGLYSNIYKYNGASWIGYKYRLLPNGDNIFFNAYHEPIIIKTPIYINNSWEMYRSDSLNIVITAVVSEIINMSFLGLTDSIATIKLFAKDTNNISIENPVNNYTLRLSKNYGLKTIFNFYTFPFTNSLNQRCFYFLSDTLNLIGITNPRIGWQNITAYDVYNWQPGWEFHTTEGTTTLHGSYPWYDYTENKIRTILNRDSIQDTLVYTVDLCFYKYIDANGNISYNRYRDTIIEKHSLITRWNRLPNEPYYEYYNGISYYIKTEKKVSESGFIFVPNQTDTNYLQPMNYDHACFYRWHTALGETFLCQGFLAQPDSLGFAYYRKDSIEFGTPFNCSTLLNSENIHEEKNDIKIFQDLSNGTITIDLIDSKSHGFTIKIFDLLGRSIIATTDTKDKYIFSLDKFKSGVYIINIQSDKFNISKKIIRQ